MERKRSLLLQHVLMKSGAAQLQSSTVRITDVSVYHDLSPQCSILLSLTLSLLLSCAVCIKTRKKDNVILTSVKIMDGSEFKSNITVANFAV